MSTTPRTDAVLAGYPPCQVLDEGGKGFVAVEFARTLEREIAQLKQQLEQVGQMMVNAQNAAVALVKERDQLKQQTATQHEMLLASQLREQRLREKVLSMKG